MDRTKHKGKEAQRKQPEPSGIDQRQTQDERSFDEKDLKLKALLEEYKSKAQDLFNLQNENNRWASLYVTALTLVAGWLITNDKQSTIAEFFNKSDNSYFIVSLALINAVFTLGMAFKGYQVQLLALYMSKELALKITNIVNEDFDNFEVWRRWDFQINTGREGKPEKIRVFYYACIGIIPVVVTAAILILYGEYVWKQHPWWGFHNLFFYFTCSLVLATLIASLSTASLNREWERHCRKLKEKQSKTK